MLPTVGAGLAPAQLPSNVSALLFGATARVTPTTPAISFWVGAFDWAGASPAPTFVSVFSFWTTVGATLAVAQNADAKIHIANTDANIHIANAAYTRAGASPAPTIGNIVGAYKSLVANHCLKIYKSHNKYMGKLWQRDYFEHTIRNYAAYQHIAEYIINNPAVWEKDKYYKL